MRQAEFNKLYKQTFPDYQVRTLTDRRLLYNDLMQQLYKDKVITTRQIYNWGHPKFLSTFKQRIDCNAY